MLEVHDRRRSYDTQYPLLSASAHSNLHIFDSQADHIVVVGPDGSLIRTVGGRGEGPGEFDNVNTAIVGRDGSYTVMGFTQIDLLEADGEFVRRITLDPMTTGLIMADLTLPGGRLVGHFRRLGDDDEQAEERSRPIHIFPLDDTEPELLYTAWELPEEGADESALSGTLETGMRMRFAAGRAFEPRLDFDVLTDGRLALIDSIGYRVKLIGQRYVEPAVCPVGSRLFVSTTPDGWMDTRGTAPATGFRGLQLPSERNWRRCLLSSSRRDPSSPP